MDFGHLLSGRLFARGPGCSRGAAEVTKIRVGATGRSPAWWTSRIDVAMRDATERRGARPAPPPENLLSPAPPAPPSQKLFFPPLSLSNPTIPLHMALV